jgi:hypothetical protein
VSLLLSSSARSTSPVASQYWRCKMLHYTARPRYCRKLKLVKIWSLDQRVSGVPQETVWILGLRRIERRSLVSTGFGRGSLNVRRWCA